MPSKGSGFERWMLGVGNDRSDMTPPLYRPARACVYGGYVRSCQMCQREAETNNGDGMKKHNITFEEHQEIASRLLNVLEDTQDLWQHFYAMTHDPRATPARRRAVGKLLNKVHCLGRAGKRAQEVCEAELSHADGTDLRAWELYYPKDRPGARGMYA